MQPPAWVWSGEDPTTVRNSDISDIDQYGSLLAPFENNFRIADENENRSAGNFGDDDDR